MNVYVVAAFAGVIGFLIGGIVVLFVALCILNRAMRRDAAAGDRS